MQFTAEQIATLLKGQVEGNPETLVDQLSKIEEAGPALGRILISGHSAILERM